MFRSPSLTLSLVVLVVLTDTNKTYAILRWVLDGMGYSVEVLPLESSTVGEERSGLVRSGCVRSTPTGRVAPAALAARLVGWWEACTGHIFIKLGFAPLGHLPILAIA